jgi:hypothetical protein
MVGDRVTILVDTGPSIESFVVEASRAGRTVEVVPPRQGMIVVRELSRGGQEIRASRFMASRVVALIEDRREAEPEPS